MAEDDAWRRRVMQVSAQLRPQDYQPWNEVRLSGWTLGEARFALVHELQRGAVSSHLARDYAGIEAADTRSAWHGHFWKLLLARLRNSELTMKACPAGSPTAVVIRPEWLDDAVPNFEENRITCVAGTYGAIRVLDSPLPAETSAQAGNIEPRESKQATRGPEHGDDFIQELLRFAIVEGCNARRELTDHMKRWCATERADRTPSDRTIERWVERYWPTGLPTK